MTAKTSGDSSVRVSRNIFLCFSLDSGLVYDSGLRRNRLFHKALDPERLTFGLFPAAIREMLPRA
jgi:hypothetical protein